MCHIYRSMNVAIAFLIPYIGGKGTILMNSMVLHRM